MTSRRPMTPSCPVNGRYGNQNGDEVLLPRLDSRNYLSSVRPENRSTFCTVMSQLTEETQPCFETTIKSKAVSEACNVKFTCVVTGYPVPELTWYKDDMELDRYCGLPKYEIFHSGKIHTLHIYNCTVDDAAIYQASARNSKGIVSCSGVLEVGDMSEYKIHQRFFAKLKQKAELKRKELEHNYLQEKENILQEQLSSSLNNVMFNDGLVHNLSSVQTKDNNEASVGEITEEKQETHIEEFNRLSQKVHRYSMRSDRSQENDNQHMSPDIGQKAGNEEISEVLIDSEEAEIGGTTKITKVNKNNITIYNELIEPLTTTSCQGPEEVKNTDKGRSTNILQLKFGDDHNKPTPQLQEITSSKAKTIKEREREEKIDTEGKHMKAERRHQEGGSRFEGEQKRSLEAKQENVRWPEPEHTDVAAPEAKTLVYKEPVNQHKSALSLVFHSLKDIFFGKSKKSAGITDSSMNVSDLNVENEILADNLRAHCRLPQTQTQRCDTTSGVCGTDQLVPVANQQQNQIETINVNTTCFQEPPSLNVRTEMEIPDLGNHIPEFTTNYIKDIFNASMIHHESVEEEKEASPEALQKNTLITSYKVLDDHIDPNNDEHLVQVFHEKSVQECTGPSDQRMQAAKEQVDSADLGSCKAQVSMLKPTVLMPNECVHRDEIGVDKRIAESNANNERNEEMEIAKLTDSTNKSETDTADVTKRLPFSKHERGQQCNDIFQDKSAAVLDMSHEESCVMENDHAQSQNSVLVINSFMENVQHFAASSVKLDTSEVESIISVGKKDNTFKTEMVECIEKNKEKPDKSKKKWLSDDTEQWGDYQEKKTDFISEQSTGVSKYTKQPENKGPGTHLRINIKVQPERHTGESRDQSVVSPIIILPDTRETVIKNVAKMRAMPLTPEIKVTVPEKVKHEDPFSVPRTDVLVAVPEYPLVNEVALAHKDKELSSEELMGIAGKAPNKNIKDGNMVITAELLDAIPSLQENNVDLLPSVQKIIQVKSEHFQTHTSNKEEFCRIREKESNNIPIISIACADDIAPLHEQKIEYVEGMFHDAVYSDSAAVRMQESPTTHVESSTEKSIKNKRIPDSFTAVPREVMGQINSNSSHDSNQVGEKAAVQKKETEKRNMLVTQLSSDISSKACQNITACDTKVCPDKESKVDPDVDRFQRDKPAIEKLGLTAPVGPTLPPLSPASLRRLMAKNNPNLESHGSTVCILGDGSEKKGEDSGCSTPTSTLSCENSPKMKRRDSLTLIPSATAEELASGARRKIYLAKTKSEDEGSDIQSKRDSPYISPSQARRAVFLQLQSGQQAQHLEKRSPLLCRRKAVMEVHTPKEEPSEETSMSNTDSKLAEKEKLDPYKAPQVIRKIRGEPFSDALGHLKLWCQFFNLLSDSTVKWFKDDVEIAEIKRSAGDENQVALAIVQASSKDCGVYSCTIRNEYGMDTTDYLLSSEILAEFFLRDDSEVGEEIEFTPLLFTKGLADPGYWGNKFFGRIITEELQIGEAYAYKYSRAKVIYGLDPIFESGSTCIVKVRNHIVYGTKEEICLAKMNLEITKQECKVHNTVREYCKIFAAEARVIEKFGFALEVIPLYLIHRPANTIPYATMEADLKGVYLKYCTIDNTGQLVTRATSEVEQKCCTFQHWIYQWTNGNLLVTQLEGVDTKITNVKIVTKSKGYQSLTDGGSPKILEQFENQHQCNCYCGLLGLRALVTIDSLQQSKLKTSRSPMLARRVSPADSSSPQFFKKGLSSPQTVKNINSTPKVAKKTYEDGDNNTSTKHKTMESPKSVRMR